jgi:hypothetical protein
VDDDAKIVIALVELATLIVCVGAGIVCRAWWNAVGIAVLWALVLGFVVYLREADNTIEGQAFALTFVFDVLKIQLLPAAFVAALASLASNAVRKHRARRSM